MEAPEAGSPETGGGAFEDNVRTQPSMQFSLIVYLDTSHALLTALSVPPKVTSLCLPPRLCLLSAAILLTGPQLSQHS